MLSVKSVVLGPLAKSQLNAALLSCAFWLASQEHILKDQFHEIIYIFLVPFRSSKKLLASKQFRTAKTLV